MNNLNKKSFQQKVKLEDMPPMECMCGNTGAWITLYELRFASALLMGQKTVVRIPRGYLCLACGHDNDFVGAEQYYGVSGIQKSSFISDVVIPPKEIEENVG